MTEPHWTPATVTCVVRAVLFGHLASLVLALLLGLLVVRP